MRTLEAGSELLSDLRARRARLAAGVMYVLFGFGMLWLFSAIGLDSIFWWDTVPRSTNAVVGVVLLGLSLPPGVAALLLHRRDRRPHAPGEISLELRHPGAVAVALVVAVVTMAVVLAALAGLVP